ncbi:hypothetical protein L593_13315 [Salinarchaeum sp. Harcht-Bsk1]|uniref:SHOCT domain-containing protein n=1 Tax=Salinarchaeum sp. Harcht-Bsk1 TaxID=1333523 RepID=UPI000342482E|nr:SHOCT domain-containing protein [Salinarchaeum sp. Harcht-Bsk1]AGN02602.1 hypothetical protein L593_13315 [Salinarchaeum sp. Harcht-Bsk1]
MSDHNGRSRLTVARLVGIALIGVLVVTAMSAPAAAHSGDDGDHHHDGLMGTHDGMGGWMDGGTGFLWMLLGTLVLVGIPVAFLYLLANGGSGRSDSTDGDALAVLRRRYAQGEIDEEEFEARRSRLRDDA